MNDAVTLRWEDAYRHDGGPLRVHGRRNTSTVGSKVRVTIEIEAEFEGGVSDQVVRTVTENSRTLKFTDHGFETD